MFVIRDDDGFEFYVNLFDLQDFSEFNRANQRTIPFGPIYKNAYKFTNYWDDDHKNDTDI